MFGVHASGAWITSRYLSCDTARRHARSHIFFSRKTTTTKRLERWRTAEFGLEPDVEQWRLRERVQAGGERRVLLRARHVSARHQSRVRPFEQLSANMRLCVFVCACVFKWQEMNCQGKDPLERRRRWRAISSETVETSSAGSALAVAGGRSALTLACTHSWNDSLAV